MKTFLIILLTIVIGASVLSACVYIYLGISRRNMICPRCLGDLHCCGYECKNKACSKCGYNTYRYLNEEKNDKKTK